MFQPSMIAVENAGLGEVLAASLRRLPVDLRHRVSEGNLLFLTGGAALLPGMAERIQAEHRRLRPLGSEIRVERAADGLLDAWRGAAGLAADVDWVKRVSISRRDYEEHGPDSLLRKYRISYK